MDVNTLFGVQGKVVLITGGARQGHRPHDSNGLRHQRRQSLHHGPRRARLPRRRRRPRAARAPLGLDPRAARQPPEPRRVPGARGRAGPPRARRPARPRQQRRGHLGRRHRLAPGRGVDQAPHAQPAARLHPDAAVPAAAREGRQPGRPRARHTRRQHRRRARALARQLRLLGEQGRPAPPVEAPRAGPGLPQRHEQRAGLRALPDKDDEGDAGRGRGRAQGEYPVAEDRAGRGRCWLGCLFGEQGRGLSEWRAD